MSMLAWPAAESAVVGVGIDDIRPLLARLSAARLSHPSGNSLKRFENWVGRNLHSTLFAREM
jgi:hypothetical protein